MIIMRPVELKDVPALMALAEKTGSGLTSLPADEDVLRARVARARRAWRHAVPRSEQGFVFVLENTEDGHVPGISAIEAAVGLTEPWHHYRVDSVSHTSEALNIHNVQQTLRLCQEQAGSSEICTLFLAPEWRRAGNGYLLSRARFLFIAAFPDIFDGRIVAQMRGVSDDRGYSPFWNGVGRHFFPVDFTQADNLSASGQKNVIAQLMPRYPIYSAFLPADARAAIGQVHPHTAPARAMLEKEGFRFGGYIDIFDGGPMLGCSVRDIYSVRNSQLKTVRAGRLPEGKWPLYLVANERWQDFRAILAHAKIDENHATLAASNLQALLCQPGERVRLIPLNIPT